MVYAVCDVCRKYFLLMGEKGLKGVKCPNCGKGYLRKANALYVKEKSVVIDRRRGTDGKISIHAN